MGCASAMGLGVALNTARPVVVLDGDGAALMKMGSLATIGAQAPANLVHVVLDNGVHDSTGGQATVSPIVDFAGVALACGYASGAACDSAGRRGASAGGRAGHAGAPHGARADRAGLDGEAGAADDLPARRRAAFPRVPRGAAVALTELARRRADDDGRAQVAAVGAARRRGRHSFWLRFSYEIEGTPPSAPRGSDRSTHRCRA